MLQAASSWPTMPEFMGVLLLAMGIWAARHMRRRSHFSATVSRRLRLIEGHRHRSFRER